MTKLEEALQELKIIKTLLNNKQQPYTQVGYQCEECKGFFSEESFDEHREQVDHEACPLCGVSFEQPKYAGFTVIAFYRPIYIKGATND